MVIDVYIWLAYRLHALKKDVEVGWPVPFSQFGAGFGTVPAGFDSIFSNALPWRLPRIQRHGLYRRAQRDSASFPSRDRAS